MLVHVLTVCVIEDLLLVRMLAHVLTACATEDLPPARMVPVQTVPVLVALVQVALVREQRLHVPTTCVRDHPITAVIPVVERLTDQEEISVVNTIIT
jgi:hypothetical protein